MEHGEILNGAITLSSMASFDRVCSESESNYIHRVMLMGPKLRGARLPRYARLQHVISLIAGVGRKVASTSIYLRNWPWSNLELANVL